MADALSDARALLVRLGHGEAAFDLAADAAPVLEALCAEIERGRGELCGSTGSVGPSRADRPMSAAVPVANLIAWAHQVDDELHLEGVAAALRGWAGDPDADVHCIRYEALVDGGGAVECPGCAGTGIDRRHDGACTLCAGTGELDAAALSAIAGELDAREARARRGPLPLGH